MHSVGRNDSVYSLRRGGKTEQFSISVRGWVRKFCHRFYFTINRHDMLLNYRLLERATFLLYNAIKTIPKRNK